MANEIVLVEYDKACRQLARALSEAKSSEEIQKVRNGAIALQAYAKAAKDRLAEKRAWEWRTLAEQKFGVGMDENKEDRMGYGGDRKSSTFSERLKPTLKQLGISNSQADRCRKLAAMTPKEFQKYINDGYANIRNPVENSVTAKPKSKPAKKTELECPHCGKVVYLKSGSLVK